MIVPTTEVQNNFGKHLKLAEREDIIITRNGKRVARLVKYRQEEDYVIREESVTYSYDGKKVLYNEFLKISEASKSRYEYIDGVIHLLPFPSYHHQKTIGDILFAFNNYFGNRKCEFLVAPYDVTLYKGENSINIVQPDIMVICDQDKIDKEGNYQGLPTLVVEVISESSKSMDFITKLDLYSVSGIKEYWIIDPFSKIVIIYIFADKEIKEMRTFKGDEKAESAVFDGLRVELNMLFA